MCLSESANMIFEMMQNNSFVKFVLPGGLANVVEPIVLDKNSEKVEWDAVIMSDPVPAPATLTVRTGSAVMQTKSTLPSANPVPAVTPARPAVFSSRLKSPKSADRKTEYSKATTNLVARKLYLVLSMIACSLIMQNQPVLNHSLDESLSGRYIG